MPCCNIRVAVSEKIKKYFKKIFQEVCRLDSYQFKGICVKNNNIYTAQRFISVADGNCYLTFYENDTPINSIIVPENMEVNIDGMFALP